MKGKNILHYKITEKLGEGGMGVVYKAEDTKLERTVALKFLPTHTLVGDEEKKRFKREAKAAAALNHANICHIYAIDEVDEQLFIAMEFIDGRSLDELVSSNGGTPLPLETTVDYACQISAGLQVAHEKGVIHRDIKAANIMVTEKGVVKIMDFGLAKLANRSKMTVEGSTLGTAAYMSPEQARGEALDKRSDIWSLGVVLYEMVAGQTPFKGDYEQAVIYSILNEEPRPLTAVRSGLPIAIDGIVAKSLAKDANLRYQNVDEIPADLKAISQSDVSVSRITLGAAAVDRTRARKSGKDVWLPWSIAALSVLALSITLFVTLTSKSRVSESLRLNISSLASQDQSLVRTDVQALALSPDGSMLVYTLSQGGQSQLYMRSLKDLVAVPLKGTANARSPFFSPDGQWLGFLADGKIKRVLTSGGAVETLCDAAGFRGASWGHGKNIIFSPQFSSGLMAISTDGGPPRQISTLDSTQHERTHRWPQVLPGGQWVLYTIGNQDNPNSYVDSRLAIQSIATGEKHILNVRGEMARYIEPGFLVIARHGSLLAAPFSLKNFKTTQAPVPVLDNIDGDGGSGISYFSVSNAGRLVYIPGIRNKELELTWVDKHGKTEPLPLKKASYSVPRLSPDGSRLAVTVGQPGAGNYDIWMYDLLSGSFNRFTFGKRMQNPTWSPDGKMLYFAASGGERRGIWAKPADGSSAETSIASVQPFQPTYVSRDGKKLIMNRTGGASDGTIFTLDLSNPEKVGLLFPPGPFAYSGNLSPDGHFLTYGSSETGTLEIFVSTFPDLEGKWQVSSASGLNPVWAPNGTEIYYISPLAKMMAVSISTKPFFSSGKPRELFDVSQMFFPNTPLANYDVAPDGKRFIMVRNTRESSNTRVFNVILNWPDELRQRFDDVVTAD